LSFNAKELRLEVNDIEVLRPYLNYLSLTRDDGDFDLNTSLEMGGGEGGVCLEIDKKARFI